MSPSVKIIVALLIAAVIWSVVFAAFAGIEIYLVIGHADFLGGRSKPYTSFENTIFYLCLIGMILSLAICPCGAFWIRQTIRHFNYRQPSRLR